ncbi:MAG: fibronectin type III domain-containing protein [Bacteroidales bacterium]|nr:fibronectin type III domain-containing protein [Bacteroidales bacterium]
MKKLLLFLLLMAATLFTMTVRAQSLCPAPTNLNATLHAPEWDNIQLNWTPAEDTNVVTLTYADVFGASIGTNSAADFIGAIRFAPEDLADLNDLPLTSVSFYPNVAQSSCTYSILIWQGGNQTDDTTFYAGTLLVDQIITQTLTISAVNTVFLTTPLQVDPTQELWIGIRCNTTEGYPLGASGNGGINNYGNLLTFFSDPFEWQTLTYNSASLSNYNWLISGIFQDPNNQLTGYNIYRDNDLIATTLGSSYIDTVETGSYAYDVTAGYVNGCESDPVSLSVTMTENPCANCQDTVVVGNGTNTTYYIPINTYYNYSFSEQIYTANELSDISGRINCISFQYIYSTDQAKDFVVYMGNTNKSSFANSSDWIPVSQMVPVFQGTLNFTSSGEGNWVNIPLSVPFEYDGNSNIVVAVLNNTGSYVTSSNYTFNSHSASGKTLYMQRDSDPYDVNALTSGSTYSYRNNIRFLIGDPVVCPMPGMLTISDISATGATVSWHSNDAHNGYELVLVPEGENMEDQTSITVNDTFYVFENLTDNTTYSVYLRAICYDENSSWIFPVTFTTEPFCTSPLNLTVSQVAGTSALVSWEPAETGATAYNVSYTEAGQENWITETVTGFHYMLSGLEPVTVYEVSVTSVCEEGSAPAATKTFTTHCLAGGEISIGEGTGTSSYVPSYSTYNFSYSQQIYMASEFNGPTDITSISMNLVSLSQQRNYKIYLAHTTATDLGSAWASTTGAQLVFSSPQTLVTGWNTFDFTTPFSYNGTDNLLVIFIDSTGSWVSGNSWQVHNTTSYCARYLYQDSSVYPLEPSSSSSGTSLSVRNNVKFGGDCDETITCIAPNAYLSDITAESVTLNWVPGYTENSWEVEYCTDTTNWISEGTVTTSPYTIDNLDANTLYTVRMRSVCGGGEYSYWATMQTRTTCDDIDVLPYTENFDSYGTGTDVFPTCWEPINTYSGSYPYITSTSYDGAGSLYFYAGTNGTHNIAIAPPISSEIPVNTLQANFMYRATNSTDMLIVGVMTDPAYESTFVPVDTIYPASQASNWMEQRVTFDQYTGEGRFIAFKNQYTSTYCYSYIDNLVINLIETCPRPMHVAAISTPSDTVYLSWDAGTGNQWDVIYGPVGFDPNDDEAENTVLIQGVTDNPYTISELAGGMGYDFYVRTDCDNDDYSEWSSFPASAYPFSYAMGINGSDTVTGCGFNITDDGGPGGNYSNNCDYTLVIYPSDPDSIVTISGTFAGEGTIDYLSVYNGISVDESELLQKITSGTSGTVITFGPLVSESGPLTLHFHSDGSVVYSGFIATASCMERPSCPRPTHLEVTATTPTSVTLEWVASGEEPSWNIEYGPAGFTQGNGTVDVATTNPFTVDNLTTGTTYDFYVQADCGSGDESEWTGPVSATPGSYNMPVTGQHSITACDLIIFDDGGLNGNYSVSCESYLTIYPEVTGNLISIQGTVNTEANYDYLYIYDGADATGTLLGTFNGQGLTVPELTSSTGPLTLHFHSDASVTYSGFQLTVSCISNTCPKPTDLIVSNINMNSADLAWTPGGDETSWNVEYKESSDATWTMVTSSTASYQLTGLTAGTNYNVRVQADCGDETSQYLTASFSTPLCDVTDQCTYTFILTDGYGDGWNGASLTVKQNNEVVSVLEANNHGGGNVASVDTVTVNLCDGASTSLEWTSGSYDDEAGFSLIGPDGTQIYTIDDMETYTTYTFTTDCSGSGPVITDPTVATVAASAIEQTTATLNATITNPDNVTITAKGFEWKATTGGSYTQIAGTGTGNTFTANLTGLTPNTGYTYKAFITFNGTTVYGNEMTFTTLEQGFEPCDVPTGLTASNITKESFDVTWNNNANVSNWNIRYRQQNGQWTSATSSTNQYSVTGLAAETIYEVQVQANCGDNNLSDWSDPLTVTTLVDGINSYLLNGIALYPNPANDVVNVQCTMNNVQCLGIEVFDVFGKLINTVNVTENTTRINVSGLANGVYFVRVTTNEGAVTKSFVKK